MQPIKYQHKTIIFILNEKFQWLFPIILVMLTYLCAWTISDTQYAVDIADQNGLKYKRCHMGWWDHCVSAGMHRYPIRCAHS